MAQSEQKNPVIAVAGTGYVGLGIAVLLAECCRVYAVDISKERIDRLREGR